MLTQTLSRPPARKLMCIPVYSSALVARRTLLAGQVYAASHSFTMPMGSKAKQAAAQTR